MMNQDRVLTLVVTIKDPEKADWIWDAHKAPVHGIKVSIIADGNKINELEAAEAAAVYYIREGDEDIADAIAAHSNDGFDTIDEAVEEANKMTMDSWTVVDRKGNEYRSSNDKTG